MDKKWVFNICLCLVTVLNFNCQSPDHTIFFTSEKVSEIDSFLTSLHQALPVPGVAIAIVKDNEVLYKTAGYRDQLQRLPMTDSTPFFMGSLSELMAATAVVKLAQSGKINLEDPVVKYLPYFKLASNNYQEIQVRHLLTHTSGIPKHDAVWDLPSFDIKALESTTRSIALQEPEFNMPGSRVKRSQYNYDVLADVIEKASGVPFEDYMNQQLQVMGMKHAAYYDSAVQNNVAVPHMIDNWLTYSLAKQPYYPHNREHAGSIGLHASVEDITLWMNMLLHEGRVGKEPFIDADFLEELFKTHYKTSEDSYVGFGWDIQRQHGSLLYTKSHYIGGFSADITLMPDEKVGILVMSNVAEEFDPGVITDQIMMWLSGGKLNAPKTPVTIPMGRKLYATHNIDSALQLYKHLKEEYPARYDYSHLALSKLGVNLMHRLDRKDDAIKVFDFVLQQYPSSPYAHLNLAEAYVVSNDIKNAEQQIAIVKNLSDHEPTVTSHITYLEEAIAIMKEEKPEAHTDDYLMN